MIIFCDGASNPHTKRSGIGAVWFKPEQFNDPTNGKSLIPGEKPIWTLSKEIYNNKGYPTNNEAEYRSLIEALKFSIDKNITNVNVFMDSKLVVNQVQNKWKINYPHLQQLKNQVDQINITFTVKHIRREYNTHADKASKDCLRKKCTYFNQWQTF